MDFCQHRCNNPPTAKTPNPGTSRFQWRIRKMGGRIHVIALLLASAASCLQAQGDRGIITGTVKDASGATMPDATVTATQLVTNTTYQTTTTQSGDFTVLALPVGNYSVKVERSGFKTQVQNDVAVAAGASVRLDVVMEVGATQQTV